MNNIRLSSMLIPALCASLLASSVALADSNGPPSYVEGNRAPKG
ncbi:peptidase S8/S53 subtilisin kexin sedolisin, partial [Bacteroides thetaiotaomicron]|nr:peptidase S8/S53 subtilisin kexin sedolisin [Bacteroides thetaiotaomicron]